MKKLKDWIKKQGYHLIEDNFKNFEDAIDSDLRVICLSTKSSKENQIFSILHEMGHLVQFKAKDYKTKFPKRAQAEKDPKIERKLEYKIELIHEEYGAWLEGEKLADKLGVKIDKEKYRAYAAKWVMTYVMKTAYGKHYHPGKSEKVKNAEIVRLLNKK